MLSTRRLSKAKVYYDMTCSLFESVQGYKKKINQTGRCVLSLRVRKTKKEQIVSTVLWERQINLILVA